MALYAFDPVLMGLPLEDETKVYHAALSELNAAEVLLGDGLVASFGPPDEVFTGSFTLSFGSFSDPTRVPVELVDVELIGRPITVLGFSTGPTVFRLPCAPTPIILIYDSTTGSITPPAGQTQIELTIDSALDFGQLFPMTFDASLASDGRLTVFVSGATAPPTIPDPPNPQRVSLGGPGRQGNGESRQPGISADGRFVAFVSDSRNLVPGDHNHVADVFVRDRKTGGVMRCSVHSDGTEANASSRKPVISADGLLVAYLSLADNIVDNDTNNSLDVFVHNRATRETVRVSVDSASSEANASSFSVAISANGRFVAFGSDAPNLVTDDVNASRDVFVHELATGATSRVSVDSSGVAGDGASDAPSLSAEGRYVAFASDAENLVATDTNGGTDVFVRDRLTNETTRVSVSSAGVEGDGFFAGSASISGDGRFVAFESDSKNLIDGIVDTNGLSDIFVRDRLTDETMQVSVNTSGTGGDGDHLCPAISANGRYVAFNSDSGNLVTGLSNKFRQVYVRDRQANETTRISIDDSGVLGNNDSGIFSFGLAISADGQFVAFESLAANLSPNDLNAGQDILIRDRQAMSTTLESVSALPAEGNDRSLAPVLTWDALSVAFVSDSDNLVAADSNNVRDVFLRDRVGGNTERVSVSMFGIEGNDVSGAPSVSLDGRFVAFESFSENLVSHDINLNPDVFVHDHLLHDTQRVSVSSAGVEGDDMSFNPSLSADGRYVAFVSYAKNLVVNDMNNVRDVFVRDQLLDETTRVSLNSADEEGNNDSGELRFNTDSRYISADGRFVAFESLATNLVAADMNNAEDIFVRNLLDQVTTRISVSSAGDEGDGRSTGCSISSDGRYVAFASDAQNLVVDDSNTLRDVFVHDRQTEETRRVSISSVGAEGNGNSDVPSISADGRFVAFESMASNLVVGDGNNVSDIFVHDCVTGKTARTTLNSHGMESDGASSSPSISYSGRYVVFDSAGENLIPDDTNGVTDVFLLDRGRLGDFDGNGAIDKDNYALWMLCFAGPKTPLAVSCPPDTDADLNSGGYVDMEDGAIFPTLFGM